MNLKKNTILHVSNNLNNLQSFHVRTNEKSKKKLSKSMVHSKASVFSLCVLCEIGEMCEKCFTSNAQYIKSTNNSGNVESRTSRSLENRDKMRPIGVRSKNESDACKMPHNKA